jgi:O-antigen/teichoic acid export membrane protein
MNDRSPHAPSARDRHTDVSHLRGDIGGRALRGGAYTVLAQLLSLVITIIGTMILARMLEPADFGLVAMATALVGAIQMFSDGGLGQATVQRSSLTDTQVSNLFWANVLLALIVGAAIAALGPLVAAFYGESRLEGITVAVGATVALSGLGIQHTALLSRQMRFKALAAIQVVSALAGWVAAIVFATLGFGYWALVANNSMFALAGIAAAWILCGWRPGLPCRGAGTWHLLRFGGTVSLAGFANYLSRNSDNILIGRFLGETPLGIYDRAYQLMLKPLRKANAPISAVLQPTLSRLGDDPVAFETSSVRLFRVMAYCATPFVVLLAVFSHEAISVLLGEKWIDAVEPFRWLALSCAAQVVTLQGGNMFISQGCGRLFLAFSSANAVIVTAAFAIGLPWGITGVSLAYAMACVFVCTPLLIIMLGRTPRLSTRSVARAIMPGVLLAAALCAGLPPLRFMLEHTMGSVASGVVIGALVVGVYALLLTASRDGRDAVSDLRAAVSGILSKPRGRHA